jgi:hypothetical protein
MSIGCGFRKETFAGTRGADEVAPIAVVPAMPSKPRIRFYSGDALGNEAGFAIGTLCVMAKKPRQFGPKDCRGCSMDIGWVASDRSFRLLVFAASGEDP